MEEGEWDGDAFRLTGKALCFSYVPQSVVDAIKDSSVVRYTKDNFRISSMTGYFPLFFTRGTLIESYKLNAGYVRLCSKPIREWTFHPSDVFTTYHLLSIVPYCGITDCIGYSNTYWFGS